MFRIDTRHLSTDEQAWILGVAAAGTYRLAEAPLRELNIYGAKS